MATFNTAFGALPKPKDQLFGNRQQPKQQQQQQQQGQGGGATFSQMQASGQARPAPQQPAQGEAGAPQPPMLSQLGSYLRNPEQSPFAPSAPARPTVQQRMLDQSNQATHKSVALAMSKGDFGPRRFVNVSGRQVTPGTVGMSGDQKVVYTEDGGMRPYTDADREAEALELSARGELPGSREAAIREQLLNDPEYADVLVKVRGMLSDAANRQAGAQQPSTGANQFQNELIQQLRSFGEKDVTDSPAMQALRASRRADIEAEFGAQAAALDEEMARRGLSASSIGAGRYGDLAGQQARAIAAMETELQSKAQEGASENKRFYLQQMLGLSGQLSSGELEKSKLSLQERQINADIDYRAKELQQEASLKGRELDLQAARDLAAKEHQSGQLQLGYSEMGSRERLAGQEISSREQISRQQLQQAANEMMSRERMQGEQFRFQAGESALERGFRTTESQLERDLRTAMQTRELTEREKGQLRDIEAQKSLQASQQTFTAEQALLERALREKMQTTELSAAEKRALMEIEANKQRQLEQQKFQSGESALERELRKALGVAELTGTYGGQRTISGQQVDISRENQTFQQNQASQQFLIQLAGLLAPMKKEDRDAFLRSNPQFASLLAGNRSTGPVRSGGGQQSGVGSGI